MPGSLQHVARRYYPLQGLLVGVALLSFGYVFFTAATRDVWFYVGCGVFAASALGCFVVDRKLIHGVRCPGCRRTMSRVETPGGKFGPIRFHCVACNVTHDLDDGPNERNYSKPL
jgi:hypothetical protein